MTLHQATRKEEKKKRWIYRLPQEKILKIRVLIEWKGKKWFCYFEKLSIKTAGKKWPNWLDTTCPWYHWRQRKVHIPGPGGRGPPQRCSGQVRGSASSVYSCGPDAFLEGLDFESTHTSPRRETAGQPPWHAASQFSGPPGVVPGALWAVSCPCSPVPCAPNLVNVTFLGNKRQTGARLGGVERGGRDAISSIWEASSCQILTKKKVYLKKIPVLIATLFSYESGPKFVQFYFWRK